MIKWSDEFLGEWWCTQCGRGGYASGNTEDIEKEHQCDPYRSGAVWAARLRNKRNPAGTVDRESGMRVEVR